MKIDRTQRVILIDIEPDWGAPFKLRYDGKYITLEGVDLNIEGYNDAPLDCIEMRNATPEIITVTDSIITIKY